MNTHATRITKMKTHCNDVSASNAKSARKENIRANVNRVGWRQKSDNPTDGSPNNNVYNALKEHEEFLQFLDPILESLQSKTVTLPAKDLASLVLSAAVLRKNATEKLSRTINSDKIPNSARSDFKLESSQKIRKTKEFKSLAEATAKKVSQFQFYLRYQIIKAQKMEHEASISQLQKTTIHYALLLSNHLVRFYKTLYGKSLFVNSPQVSSEKILAQNAVRTIFKGDLNDFKFEDSAISEKDDSEDENESEDIPKFVSRNNANYCKFLQFLGVKSNTELLNVFNEFVYGVNRKSANISTQDEEATTPEEASTSTATNTLNSIANVTNDNTPVPSIETTEHETDISNITTEFIDNGEAPFSKSSTSSSSTTTEIVQHGKGLPPTPRCTPVKIPITYTEQDNKILDDVMPILFKLIPLLTVSVFERYQENSQLKLAEAECAAMYENTKRSQMCNEVSNILDNEQSVKAPIIKNYISEEVQTEMKKMRNQIKTKQHKIDKANKKLTSLKKQQQQDSPKDQAVSNSQKTKANLEQITNEKKGQRNHRQPEKSHPNQKPILKMKSTSTTTSNSNEKDTTKIQSSSRDIVKERKEKKRQRNLRQRESRKRRKLESLADPNSVNGTTDTRN